MLCWMSLTYAAVGVGPQTPGDVGKKMTEPLVFVMQMSVIYMFR